MSHSIAGLALAVAKGETIKVKSLLDAHHTPIDHIGAMGMTYLIAACMSNHPGTALALISRSANVFIKDDYGSTALEYAAARGLSTVLQALLRKGAPINSKNRIGETALFVGARQDQKEAVRVLIEAGGMVDLQRNDGYTPLFAAVSLSHEEVVKLLLKAGADPNMRHPISKYSALMRATRNGRLDICRLLLAHGADPTATQEGNGYTSLHYASDEGYVDICSALVEAGALVKCRSQTGSTPLSLAKVNGHKDVYDYLICHRAGTSRARSAFSSGVIRGREEDFAESSFFCSLLHGCLRPCLWIIEWICSCVACLWIVESLCSNCVGRLFSTRRQTVKADLLVALVTTVREGGDIVEKWGPSLIRRSVDSSLPCNSLGHTLLHVAAIEGHHHLIDILLDMGAQVDCRTIAGLTPLHLSVDGGHLESTKRLIARGANVSLRRKDGGTCLMRVKDLPIAKELLAVGADPSAGDKYGATALHHLAAREGKVGPIICALVQAGARPDAQDKKGRTPADVARLSDCLDTEALLLGITKQASHKTVGAGKRREGGGSNRCERTQAFVAGGGGEPSDKEAEAQGIQESAPPLIEEVESESEGEFVCRNRRRPRLAIMSAPSSGTLLLQAPRDEVNYPTDNSRRKARITKVRPCARCGTVTHRRCSDCKKTFFCGRECFKAAWKDHKAECLAIQGQQNAAGTTN